jgi:hypothetical protein
MGQFWWLPFVDVYRTRCAVPTPSFRLQLKRMADLALAAALAPWSDLQTDATYTIGDSALGTCSGSPL